MSRLAARLLVVALLIGCVPPRPIDDAHAVGPDFNRWEARVAAPRDSVFNAALQILADSGFTARAADRGEGIIGTNVRHGQGSFWGSQHRLNLMILPAGADSTRVMITGEWCHVDDGAQKCYPRTARSDDWGVVRGIGEAVLQRFALR